MSGSSKSLKGIVGMLLSVSTSYFVSVAAAGGGTEPLKSQIDIAALTPKESSENAFRILSVGDSIIGYIFSPHCC